MWSPFFFRLLELVMSRSSTTTQYLSVSWHVNKLIHGMISSLHITTNYWFHTIHVCSFALDDDKLLNLACFSMTWAWSNLFSNEPELLVWTIVESSVNLHSHSKWLFQNRFPRMSFGISSSYDQLLLFKNHFAIIIFLLWIIVEKKAILVL